MRRTSKRGRRYIRSTRSSSRPASPAGVDVVVSSADQDPAANGLWHLKLAQYDGDPPVRQGLYLFVLRVGFVLNGLMRFGAALASARIDGPLPRIPRPE